MMNLISVSHSFNVDAKIQKNFQTSKFYALQSPVFSFFLWILLIGTGGRTGGWTVGFMGGQTGGWTVGFMGGQTGGLCLSKSLVHNGLGIKREVSGRSSFARFKSSMASQQQST